MRFFVMVLFLPIVIASFGCATLEQLGGPPKQDAEKAWDSIDTTSNGWDVIYPKQASCYDRSGRSISPQSCDDVQTIKRQISEYRRSMELQPTECAVDEYMTAQDKVNFAKFCQQARQKRIKRSEDLKSEVLQKESLLRELVPKSTEGILSFTQNTQNRENAQIAELDKVISSKGLSAEALTKDKRRQVFVRSSSTKYGLSNDEFKFEVIRGDWVDDWGLSLGETVYEIEQSPKVKIVNHTASFQAENKVFELSLKAGGQQVLVKFVLLKDKRYALLDTVKVGSEIYSGYKAELVLGQLLNK